MSGVRTGSRLDQLLALARQVELNIELERRRGARPTPGRVTPVTTPVLPRQESSPTPLVQVPVRSVRVDVIRDWAATNGYALTDRGRIPHVVLEEFQAAHR